LREAQAFGHGPGEKCGLETALEFSNIRIDADSDSGDFAKHHLNKDTGRFQS
jgi:hypothetical protein